MQSPESFGVPGGLIFWFRTRITILPKPLLLECTGGLPGLFLFRLLRLSLVPVHVTYSAPLSLFMYPALLSTRSIRVLRGVLVARNHIHVALRLRKFEE